MKHPFFLPLFACATFVVIGCQPAGSSDSSPQNQQTVAPQQTDPAAQSAQSQEPANTTQEPANATPGAANTDVATDDQTDDQTIDLFDGESLDDWEITNYGGEGEVVVEDGEIVIAAGYPISGINSIRDDLPKTNYEISLDVKKTDGIDFFCGLTFPVADSHCTFVIGGWAGSVVGLSNIDDVDASQNESRKLMKFEKDQWYKIKVQVVPERIKCWIDDELVVDQNIVGKTISLRNETLPSRPLGISNFETTSRFKNIKLKILDEIPPAETNNDAIED